MRIIKIHTHPCNKQAQKLIKYIKKGEDVSCCLVKFSKILKEFYVFKDEIKSKECLTMEVYAGENHCK